MFNLGLHHTSLSVTSPSLKSCHFLMQNNILLLMQSRDWTMTHLPCGQSSTVAKLSVPGLPFMAGCSVLWGTFWLSGGDSKSRGPMPHGQPWGASCRRPESRGSVSSLATCAPSKLHVYECAASFIYGWSYLYVNSLTFRILRFVSEWKQMP